MNILAHITPTQKLYLSSILGSILISIWLNINTLINPDGVLYLQASQAFLQGGLDASLAVYDWPFYSILIALLHQITFLSLEHAALLLNTLLCIAIVTAFISLVKVLHGNFQVQVCALIVILVHTGLNDYRAYIIRDFGHWAFMLYALYFLILYAQNRRLRDAIAWGCAIFIAFLFRTEAVFVMILAPLCLLFASEHTFKQRLIDTALGYVFFIPLVILGVLTIDLLSANPWLNAADSIQWVTRIQNEIEQFRPIISHHVRDNELIYFMLGGLLGYFFIRLFILLTLPYTLLLGMALYQRLMPASIARRLLITFILIYTAVVLAFLSYQFFLAGRYIMPIVLLLSLWVPFALSAIYDRWKKRKTWLFPFVVLLLVYMLGDSVISSASTQLYMKDAGIWLGDHALENTTSLTNNQQVSHYSQHAVYVRDNALIKLLDSGDWKKVDYLAIASKNADTSLRERLDLLPMKPIQVFSNENGSRIDIYQINENN